MNILNKITTNVQSYASLTLPFWQLFRSASKYFGSCCGVSYWCCEFLALIHPFYSDSKLAKCLACPAHLGKDKINISLNRQGCFHWI